MPLDGSVEEGDSHTSGAGGGGGGGGAFGGRGRGNRGPRTADVVAVTVPMTAEAVRGSATRAGLWTCA